MKTASGSFYTGKHQALEVGTVFGPQTIYQTEHQDRSNLFECLEEAQTLNRIKCYTIVPLHKNKES